MRLIISDDFEGMSSWTAEYIARNIVEAARDNSFVDI